MPVPEHDDDLYGGYDEASNPLQGSSGATMFQAVGAEGGANVGPPGSARSGTAMMRQGTASGSQAADGGRPMTSNRGAGFTSAPNKKFDPLNQRAQAMGPALNKLDITPEERAHDMEKKVHELLENSALACQKQDFSGGLEKALEARKREKALCKFREANEMVDQINIDLTYAVDFNVAHMHHMNGNHPEALTAYTALVKNKNLPQSGRLRVNMGNVYFEQKKYPNAIKMYRMALDQIPPTAKEIKYKIMRNIGMAFVRMGQYQDAVQSFTTVMDNVPDHQTGYNLVVCEYALGDKEGMKHAFMRLLEMPSFDTEAEDEEEDEQNELNHDLHDDGLKDELKKRQNQTQKYIVTAAQLIAEKIDRNGWIAGYDWCIEQLREHTYDRLANEVHLAKASKYIAQKDFNQAIAVFKEFEKKEPRVKARAATNLSFLHLLEGKLDLAEQYSEMATKGDKYNARAFVNKGGVLFEKGDFEGSKVLFTEAAGIEPYCVEAVYNLGLADLRSGDTTHALAAFRKLHNMLPDNTEVMYQVANCYEATGDYKNCIKWLEMLSSYLPNDPGVLARLGGIHARLEDEAKALHYYQEAHRVFPVNMDVISWLGAFYVRSEVYEKAMPYFDLASKIQPSEVKWALMVASCLRRINAYPQALAKYKEIHSKHPDNVECLRYLVNLCVELGRRDELTEYNSKLSKVEKAARSEATAAAATAAAPRMQMAAPAMEAPAPQAGNRNMDPDDPGLTTSNASLHGRGRKVVAKTDDHRDDDWGNEQLGDDLLPM